jgi:hypothetical protein
MNIQLHLDHLLKASPEDQLELLQRVAALAWIEGFNLAAEAGRDLYTKTFPNPYSADH